MKALDALIKAPESINPAIRKSLELRQLDAEGKIFAVGAKVLLELKPQIDQAIKDGRAEAAAVSHALAQLKDCFPETSNEVPTGF